jgi:hypothetical protein
MATAFIQKQATNWLYNKNSRYMLNLITLNIIDDRINKKMNEARTNYFNRLLVPVFIVTLLRLIYITSQYFNTGEDAPIHFLSAQA